MTGSVASVKTSDALKATPTGNISDALQGRMAGVSVLSGSGDPSSDNTIRVRGVNSISGEGASMAQVATLNKVPFVIIRAISDKADNSAPVAYETFEEQAIVHTVKLLAAMFLKMSK